MNKPKITDEQLREHLKQGMSQSAIARLYKMHPSSVSSRIKRMKKASTVKKSLKPANKEERESDRRIKEAYESYGKKQAKKQESEAKVDTTPYAGMKTYAERMAELREP